MVWPPRRDGEVSAQALIDTQYADRAALRPVLDALIRASTGLGPVVVRARKTFVSLVTPRRTFARVQSKARTRVDLCLRLPEHTPVGRLRRSKLHATMPFQIGLASADEVDAEVVEWLRRAYEANR
ncbi:MAG: DUF5655 domain-containing protein [Gemmatimonadales bacterium]